MDLKQALKSNEKLFKDKLGMEEDYKKVSTAAGQLQQEVHVLEEEVKDMKVKVELDNDEKEKAQIAHEELQKALDEEGVPKCPICSRRFPNIDVLSGHMDIKHPNIDQSKHLNDSVNMENSNQSGYGTTEQFQLVSVQCKKCNGSFINKHLLRIHMNKHTKEDKKVVKCTTFDFETPNENTFMEHVIDSHSTIHVCQSCNNRFPTRNELVEHIKREHRFQPNNQHLVTPVLSQNSKQTEGQENIKCFDRGVMLKTKDDLMKHKKTQHWKQKPCPYYHGSGGGCRFPDRVCFNMHMLSDHQGQLQGAGGSRARDKPVKPEQG